MSHHTSNREVYTMIHRQRDGEFIRLDHALLPRVHHPVECSAYPQTWRSYQESLTPREYLLYHQLLILQI